jgi:hypothetical protein
VAADGNGWREAKSVRGSGRLELRQPPLSKLPASLHLDQCSNLLPRAAPRGGRQHHEQKDVSLTMARLSILRCLLTPSRPDKGIFPSPQATTPRFAEVKLSPGGHERRAYTLAVAASGLWRNWNASELLCRIRPNCQALQLGELTDQRVPVKTDSCTESSFRPTSQVYSENATDLLSLSDHE